MSWAMSDLTSMQDPNLSFAKTPEYSAAQKTASSVHRQILY